MSVTQEKTTPNMRGWGRIRIGSTKLSRLSAMRKNFKLIFGHWKDSQPCMWEITVRVPPTKKRKP